MLVALLALLFAVLMAVDAQAQTPNQTFERAGNDLFSRSPAKRQITRYLSLNAYAEVDRPRVIQTLDFAVNSLSWRSALVKGEVLGKEALLYRIDLEALGWDRDSRIAQRAELARRGVNFTFKTTTEEAQFLDPWEAMAAAEPYFKTSQLQGNQYLRGWIDPVAERLVRQASYSSNAVIRADWFLAYALVEKERGGFYSQLLMLPAKEQDLYKALLIPIDTVERATQLRYGGAVAQSVVAFHNRGLEVFYSPYGRAARYVWRTYDFLDDRPTDKNIYEALGGTLKHDGRELIGSLPNGLQFYMLFNAAGAQVDVVPQNIAMDMRRDTPDRDRNVRNAIKCISCHEVGINPYEDQIRGSALREDIGLATFDRTHARATGQAYRLEDYYRIAERGGLAREVTRHIDSYAESVEDVNGLKPAENAKQTVGWYDAYLNRLVTLDQAAREMGLAPDAAREALRRSETAAGYSVLRILSSGQSVSRTQWEVAYPAAMRALSYSWDLKVGKVKRGEVMLTTLILAALVPSQYRQCNTRASYQRTYNVQYAAPTYYQQAAYYAYPATAFIAAEQYDRPTYAALVASSVRADNRRDEDQRTISALTTAIQRLEARVAAQPVQLPTQPAPSKSLEAPGKQPPQNLESPSKQSPPPLPKTNPGPGDDNVPPPPPRPDTPPGPGSAGPVQPVSKPDQGTLAIFKRDCAKCHTDPAKEGDGVVLLTKDGQMAELHALTLPMIDSQLYSGDMPKKAREPMNTQDYSRIRAWINDNQTQIEAALHACKLTEPTTTR